MSHEATNWAIKQRGLKPATKIVLWHLAERHNPAGGCSPSQEYLADACEMSRASVNRHLELLEQIGLIRRIRSFDPLTRRQKPTEYILNIGTSVGCKREKPTKAAKRTALGKKKRALVFFRDDWRCGYCGTREGPHEIDHMTPLSRGGSNHDDNLVLACRKCNRSKGTRTAEEFAR